MLLIIITILTVFETSFSAEIPDNLQKCDRQNTNFNNCLVEATNDVFAKGKTEFKQINLVTLDPLEVPALDINAGTSAVHFDQHYKDLKILGISELKCSKVEMNFDSNMLNLQCLAPLITVKFNYKFNGRLLVLPITGDGPGSFSLKNLKLQQTFQLEEYEKKGKKFYRVDSSKLDMTPEKITFQFDNLFNGEKLLGDNINKVFNENWEAVFSDIKPSYEEAFSQIFMSVFNNVLQKVSVQELFGNK